MLYSVIIGNQSKIFNNWEIKNDDYNHPLICNDSIRQRIRLGKNVPKNLELDYSCANVKAFKIEEETEEDSSYANAVAYKISGKNFISNNNKNMNLTLLNFYSKDEEVMETHVNDNIVYITLVNENYTLVDYLSEVDIAQTYRKTGQYQGCVLTFKEKPEDGTIAVLYCKDLKKNRFVSIVVSFTDKGRLVVEKQGIDKNYLKTLRGLYKKLQEKKRQEQFRIQVPDGKLLTSLYITGSGEAYNTMYERTKDDKHAVVIQLDQSKLDENYLEDHKVKKFLTEQITEKRIRAVTFYGVKLPWSFCKDFNIMYLFEYDAENDRLNCVKSN